MANAVLMALGLGITGLIFAIVIKVIGDRQDREAKQAKQR
jgi:hypothetical protein